MVEISCQTFSHLRQWQRMISDDLCTLNWENQATLGVLEIFAAVFDMHKRTTNKMKWQSKHCKHSRDNVENVIDLRVTMVDLTLTSFISNIRATRPLTMCMQVQGQIQRPRSTVTVKVHSQKIKMFLFRLRCTLQCDVGPMHSDSPDGSTTCAHDTYTI